MAEFGLRIEGRYRRVNYILVLVGTVVGKERWTYRVDINQVAGWVVGDTFDSPKYYSTDFEARLSAIELVKLHVDGQWGMRLIPSAHGSFVRA
ncbi:hypothetical protein ACQKEK_13510 [Pseudomonas sp. NPDC077408]|tara:strand:- start:1087 stop:1365 length:279 start_codon:yes stop_codon:yes gene_type:complete